MQTTRRTILFPGDDVTAPIDEVGGKACSLLRLCRVGLPVPPGCVLTTAFFELWSASIRETTAWHAIKASGGVVPASCAEALQNHCQSLPYSPDQQKVLEQSLRHLPNRSGVWVVRSSSPAEDLGEASSAGLYRTEIGVPTEALCDAIRNVFASSFEERVFAYQRRKGHTTSLPQMAVIVQEAVPADVAGIAFSSNPVSNSHQEVVINAGWGLGESIVSGRVSPDELVLAKHGAAILDRKMGGKETAIFLLPGGGVRECHGYRSGRFCLEEEDAVALRDLTLRVEELYGCPVDVEWASLNGEMLLLQARPVTTMVPLPEALRTAVDTPARMYLDLTLVEHGMQGALSPLGSSWMDLVLGYTLESLTAHPRLGRDAVTGIGQVVDGRMYLNISNLMWVMKPRMISLIFGGLDAYSAAIIRSADPGQWKTPGRPPLLSGILAASLRHSHDLFFHAARGFLLPETVAHECRASTAEFLRALDDLESQDLSFADYCRQAGRLTV
ncbi:MAG TPA: hypothetical protein ENN44_03705 [Methanoculleus sp.]|nr:hypothetical protein [Methanoculleus sp.]